MKGLGKSKAPEELCLPVLSMAKQARRAQKGLSGSTAGMAGNNEPFTWNESK